jgi:hypothetical protein
MDYKNHFVNLGVAYAVRKIGQKLKIDDFDLNIGMNQENG